MRDGSLRMVHARIGVTRFAMLHGFLEVLHPFIQMRILHAGGLRVFERFFGVLRTGVRVALFPMRPGAFGVFDRFFNVFIARHRYAGQRGHRREQHNRTQHQHLPTVLSDHGLLHSLKLMKLIMIDTSLPRFTLHSVLYPSQADPAA